MRRLLRFLKLADTLDKNKSYEDLNHLCIQFDTFIKKHSHYAPMQGPGDYDFSKETGNLPWSGSTTEFLKNFPGGLPQWKAEREKLKAQSFEFKDKVMYNKNEMSQIKNANFSLANDTDAPNPWRKNMDYSTWENSPYFGSVSEFMKKFPGGIKDWIKWKKGSKKERFHKLDNKKSYCEPVEKDNVKRFERVKELIENYRKNGQSADDAVRDFIEYYKLLEKSKDRRK